MGRRENDGWVKAKGQGNGYDLVAFVLAVIGDKLPAVCCCRRGKV